MARTAHSHYYQLQVARLKDLATQRGLLMGGSKGNLIERLLSYDSQHPFPFLKLPSELRDMIYRLIVEDDTQFAESGKQLSYTFDRNIPNPQKLRHFRPEKRNRLMIQQPNILVTCKTIRAEGLPVFLRRRDFHFVVNEGILTLKMVLRWINCLSTTERSNIRWLTVQFLETFQMEWVIFLNDLVGLPPPQAIVVSYAAMSCDDQKFQIIKATWDVLKPKARVPDFCDYESEPGRSNPTKAKFSDTTWQAFESEGSLWPSAAELIFGLF